MSLSTCEGGQQVSFFGELARSELPLEERGHRRAVTSPSDKGGRPAGYSPYRHRTQPAPLAPPPGSGVMGGLGEAATMAACVSLCKCAAPSALRVRSPGSAGRRPPGQRWRTATPTRPALVTAAGNLRRRSLPPDAGLASSSGSCACKAGSSGFLPLPCSPCAGLPSGSFENLAPAMSSRWTPHPSQEVHPGSVTVALP